MLNILGDVENLTRRAQHLFAGRNTLAPEFSKADIAPVFRANGTLNPGTTEYKAHVADGFRDWRDQRSAAWSSSRSSLSIADLRAMPLAHPDHPARLRRGLELHRRMDGRAAAADPGGGQARNPAAYVVFYCADPMGDGRRQSAPYYYESLDLMEATHPQTILAYDLNGKPLPVEHGAPVRLRAERQLGYKMAKYVQRIELVDSFDKWRRQRRLLGGSGLHLVRRDLTPGCAFRATCRRGTNPDIVSCIDSRGRFRASIFGEACVGFPLFSLY